MPHISTDSDIKLDYDIVYVRARRAGDTVHKRFYTDFSQPVAREPGADLMLLHPDGTEELLVAGGDGSITDPVVSFDGRWVYYVHHYDLRNHNQWSPPARGADDRSQSRTKVGTAVRQSRQRAVANPGRNPGEEVQSRRRFGRRSAARAAIEFGFDQIGLQEIVSYTMPANVRSRRVMERIGMTHDPAADFDHPLLPEWHPLRRHVFYRLARPTISKGFR